MEENQVPKPEVTQNSEQEIKDVKETEPVKEDSQTKEDIKEVEVATPEEVPGRIKLRVKKAYPWMVLSAILGIGLIISIFWHGSPTGAVVSDLNNKFIYMDSELCDEICEKLEPVAKEVAEKVGLEFIKLRYGRPTRIPGFVLIHDNELIISGIEDKVSLLEQICELTANENICAEVERAKLEAMKDVCERIPKRDKPNFKIFYMSYCPFGIQTMKGFSEVAKLFGDKIEFEPHFVIYENYRGGGADYCIANGSICSMHGIEELNEDIRQACVWKYEKDKFWDYTMCVMNECSLSNIETCWRRCADKVNLNRDKIINCFKDEGATLMEKEKELNREYGVSGSPTMFINDERYRWERTPETFKQYVCCGFNSPPEECKESLSTISTAPAGTCS